MSCQFLVSAWDQLLLMFFWAFTEPTARTFTGLATGWVLAPGRRTITGIIPFADPDRKRSHDSYHGFFPDAAWSMGDLWRTWAVFLVESFHPEGRVPLVLDDTLYHRSGRKVDGAGWWRDAVRSTGTKVVHAWGLNLVVLCVRVRPPWGGEPLALPINMRLHRKGGAGPLMLAEEMVGELAAWLPDRAFTLTADGFYAPLAGRGLPRTALRSRMRRDAALYEQAPKPRKRKRGRPRKKGARLPAPRAMRPRAADWRRVEVDERGKPTERLLWARVVLWYEVCKDSPVLLVISRDPTGKQKDDFFFTTDVTERPEVVVSDCAGRWSIEDTFKNTKQLLGGQHPQTWKRPGPERAAAFGLLIYGLVWAWYLRHGHGEIPLRVASWYPRKARPSFGDALSALRTALWRSRIFPDSGPTPAQPEIISTLIDALAAAA